MATLEERIQNLTQSIRPTVGSGVMSDADAQRVIQTLGGNNNTMPIGSGVMSDADAERITQATSQVDLNKALLGDMGVGVAQQQAGMLGEVDLSVFQPLVDMGYGNEVRTILTNPSYTPESKAAQRKILSELGNSIDVDNFLMEVEKNAPNDMANAMSQVDQIKTQSSNLMPVAYTDNNELITQLREAISKEENPVIADELKRRLSQLFEATASQGRDGDTTVAHLTEGEIVIPAPVFDANPQAADSLEKTMIDMGIDPRTRMVDSTGQLGGIASINPETGLQEFGFLSKAWKKIKNVGRKVAKVAQFVPGPHQPFAKAVATADSVYSGIKNKDPFAVVSSFAPSGSGINSLFTGNTGKGNIFSRIGEYIMPGQDKVGLFGNLAKLPSQIKSGIGGLFTGREYDPATGEGYDPATGKGQSRLGYIEDIFKALTGDDMLTRSQELEQAGYTEEEIEQAKADGTFNQLVAQARAEGKISGRGLIGGAGNILGGLGESLGITDDKAGLTGLGNLGLAGLAGLIGKLAYEEAKGQKGVPLTPLTTMDALGRYNIAAEIARQQGEAMPSRVEYGLMGEGMPVLSGGRPTTSEGTVYQPPETRMAARGGIMAFAQGGSVAKMNEGGETEIEINIEEFPRKDGQIDGPGTETSDDIPAMLSDGEFVMTAKAVRGAGSYDLQDQNGILTLTPNGASGRDSGTRIMYKLMEHFSKVA